MPRTTTKSKRKFATKGLSVKITEPTYTRLEAIKSDYPTLRFDDCIRAALAAWDIATEGTRNQAVLSVVQCQTAKS